MNRLSDYVTANIVAVIPRKSELRSSTISLLSGDVDDAIAVLLVTLLQSGGVNAFRCCSLVDCSSGLPFDDEINKYVIDDDACVSNLGWHLTNISFVGTSDGAAETPEEDNGSDWITSWLEFYTSNTIHGKTESREETSSIVVSDGLSGMLLRFSMGTCDLAKDKEVGFRQPLRAMQSTIASRWWQGVVVIVLQVWVGMLSSCPKADTVFLHPPWGGPRTIGRFVEGIRGARKKELELEFKNREDNVLKKKADMSDVLPAPAVSEGVSDELPAREEKVKVREVAAEARQLDIWARKNSAATRRR
ncbi:hypothetical protein Tco_0366019 [Tanacetum coccineum]